MGIDLEALRARNEARRRGQEQESATIVCAAEVDELLGALQDAYEELRELREEYADLEASANLWADLYSSCVKHANTLEERVRALEGSPVSVQRYYAALDAIAVLTEALEHVVRECAQCALDLTSNLRDIARDRLCGRCVRAVDALLATWQVR